MAESATDAAIADATANSTISQPAAESVAANTAIERTIAIEEVVLVEAVVVVAALEAALAEAALGVTVPAAVPTAEDTVSVVPSAEAITLDVALAADAVTETATATEDGRVRLWLCGPGGSSGASA